MKKALALIPLLLAGAAQAAPLKTISKFEFGEKWPFTREEVMINCRDGNALWVINPSTLMSYPLNDVAAQQAKEQKIKVTDLSVITLKQTGNTEKGMDLTPIIEAAGALCGDK
ncbi:YebY family protein [Morganella morganii]|uniref:YebY family protein n=1 Tax=Morganella morganii TaxID=582 RepID=UPI001967115A|nr:YebY family protein [Morganella morganii]EKT0591527.1 YebY family protein [Morganella morganii]ELT0452087.1 YebY family protein [Morganella morganii]MBT0335241.1 YebY family protein [Morganella morganii subsp. morganii]MBT0388945.1 YebY family protein [Morganella morganii subsp. morganii]MBT0394424.1 YebY family protein [Morganella morganii subsp. morganii]